MKSAASATVSGKGLALSENSLKVLEKRYLKRNEDGTVIETAVDMFTRVARTIAEADKAIAPAQKVVELEPDDAFSYTALSVVCVRCGRIVISTGQAVAGALRM